MEIRKTYQSVNPELLYDEIRDFALKQGVVLSETKLETYPIAGDSSSFISRGNLAFKTSNKADEKGRECLRVHIVGSAKGETRVIINVDEELFPLEKLSTLQKDLDFVFTSYEVTHPDS
ncbi:MAG: hypothetical protein PHI12_05280 [Dehalococcoidales bacterium]|jgi:hypothetical protein|nr:hypothetical protein [Dehalococcoidales bacterium]